MKGFGKRLKNFRKRAEITQAELAEKLNVHVQTVSRWERDSSVPDMVMYGTLANLLNVSLEELWGVPAAIEKFNGQFDALKLGKAIAAERKRLNESQDVLASITGASSDTVSKWERGLTCPDVDAFLVLADHFAIAPSALYYAQIKQEQQESVILPVSPSKPKRSKKNIILAIILCLLFLAATVISVVLIFVNADNSENVETPDCDHQYERSVTDPTCTAKGYTTYTCTACGDSYKSDYTETVPHASGEWIVDREATCTREGSKHTECVVCRTTTATESIGKLLHDYRKAVTDPTCTTQGYTTYTCSLCGDNYKSDYEETIPHTSGAWIIDREATCTREGSKHTECTVCRTTTATESIEKLAHDYRRKVTDPTCTTQGYTTYTCSSCGDNYKSDYTDTIPHVSGAWIIDKDATCRQEGSKHTNCTVCGTTMSTESIEKLAHDYKKAVTDPTCTAQGYTTYTCSSCGDNYKSDFVATIPHTPGEWITDREATCGIAGSRHRECAVCHTTMETVVIEKLEHSYSYVIVPPQGDNQGYYLYTCGLCGDSYKDNYFFEDDSDLEFAFDYNAKICMVTGPKDKNISKAVIPSVVNGCTVTKIGGGAFMNCTTLREVVIPGTVVEIDYSAFWGCVMLKEAVIPNSVTKIGERVFQSCKALVRVVLPEGLKRIEFSTFGSCINLQTVNIPSSVTVLEESAFGGCEKLRGITLPEGLLTIGDTAFVHCKQIEELYIPRSVVYIGSGAFDDCTALTSVTFEITDGWEVDGTAVESELLVDPQTAAEYLSKKYSTYIWIKD